MAVFIVGDGRPEGTSVGRASTEKVGFYGEGGAAQQTVNVGWTTTATTTTLESTVNSLLVALAALNLIESDAS